MKVVLKHGNSMYITKCPDCDCVFLYEHIDIIYRKNFDGNWEEQIECPECGTTFYAKKKKYNDK